MQFPYIPDYDARVRAKRFLPKTAESNVHPKVAKCLLEALVHPTETICELANCICKGLIQIPCGKIKNVTISDIRDYSDGCYQNIRIPLPPQLERLSIRNFGIQDNTTLSNAFIPDAPSNVVKACLHPGNKLKYLESRILQLARKWVAHHTTHSIFLRCADVENFASRKQ